MTEAVLGGSSVCWAYGSALSSSSPSAERISYLYRSPAPTSGRNSSQMPPVCIERIACRRPSQELKSPTTLTARAAGAQTANAVPFTPWCSRTWAPSLS